MKKLLSILILVCGFQAQAQWEIISPGVPSIGNSYMNLHFLNADTGFVVGIFANKASILRTYDGGTNWDTTIVENITGINGSMRAIEFPVDTVGYAAGTGSILKTTDYGDNWFEVDTADAYNTFTVSDIIFVNKDTGYIGWADGGAGGLLTTDGGWSWQQDPILLGVRHFSEFQGEISFCAEAWGKLNTQQLDWTVYDPISYGYYHYRSSINLNNRIFVIGNVMGASSLGIFSYTDDLGNAWVGEKFPHRLEDIFFLNDSVGYMVGGFPGTVQSIDGGMTWYYGSVDNLGTGMKTNFNEAYFVNDSLGYAVSDDGIYKTTNAGGPYTTQVVTWPYDLSVNEENLELEIFPNPSNGQFTLNTTKTGVLKIYTLNGQLLQSVPISGQNKAVHIPNGSGTYLLVFHTEQGVYRKTVQVVE